MMKARLVVFGMLALAGCTNKDMTGRELTDVESQALDTCNDWLASRLESALGKIRSEEAVFHASDGQLSIAWEAQTVAGRAEVVCATNASGTSVKGALVDGVWVRA